MFRLRKRYYLNHNPSRPSNRWLQVILITVLTCCGLSRGRPVPLTSRDGTQTQPELSRRGWVKGIQAPRTSAYLGDPCDNTASCLVPHSVCENAGNRAWRSQKFCTCGENYHPLTGYCEKDLRGTAKQKKLNRGKSKYKSNKNKADDINKSKSKAPDNESKDNEAGNGAAEDYDLSPTKSSRPEKTFEQFLAEAEAFALAARKQEAKAAARKIEELKTSEIAGPQRPTIKSDPSSGNDAGSHLKSTVMDEILSTGAAADNRQNVFEINNSPLLHGETARLPLFPPASTRDGPGSNRISNSNNKYHQSKPSASIASLGVVMGQETPKINPQTQRMIAEVIAQLTKNRQTTTTTTPSPLNAFDPYFINGLVTLPPPSLPDGFQAAIPGNPSSSKSQSSSPIYSGRQELHEYQPLEQAELLQQQKSPFDPYPPMQQQSNPPPPNDYRYRYSTLLTSTTATTTPSSWYDYPSITSTTTTTERPPLNENQNPPAKTRPISMGDVFSQISKDEIRKMIQDAAESAMSKYLPQYHYADQEAAAIQQNRYPTTLFNLFNAVTPTPRPAGVPRIVFRGGHKV